MKRGENTEPDIVSHGTRYNIMWDKWSLFAISLSFCFFSWISLLQIVSCYFFVQTTDLFKQSFFCYLVIKTYNFHRRVCLCLRVCVWVFISIISKSSWPVSMKLGWMILNHKRQSFYRDEINGSIKIDITENSIFYFWNYVHLKFFFFGYN